MNAPLFDPPGFDPYPRRRKQIRDPAEDEKGFRIARTEERVFDAQPDATHFRYPWVYGPRQPAPREWCIVRRILDERERIIVAEDGLSLSSFGFTENVAHALLLAVDQPEKARGRVYNVADQEVLSIRQVIEVIAKSMGHTFDIVSLPWEIAWPARPIVGQPWTTHRIVSTARIEQELGYRDKVPPKEALALTARWLAENRPTPGGPEEMVCRTPSTTQGPADRPVARDGVDGPGAFMGRRRPGVRSRVQRARVGNGRTRTSSRPDRTGPPGGSSLRSGAARSSRSRGRLAQDLVAVFAEARGMAVDRRGRPRKVPGR